MSKKLLVCTALTGTLQSCGPVSMSSVQKTSFASAITFSGSPSQIGEAHGQQLGDKIDDSIHNWLTPFVESLPRSLQKKLNSDTKKLKAHLPSDFKVELDSIHRSPVDIGNLLPDLMSLAAHPLGCSTFVVTPNRSTTGGMIFGRNLDYAQSSYLRDKWQIMIYRKTSALAILTIGVPGIAGVLSGLNERGVAMTINMSYSSDSNSTDGVGALAIIRSVLETATSARDAVDRYQQFTRTVAVNISVADSTDAFVLEATPSRSKVRLPKSGVVYAANHYENADLGDHIHGRDERWETLAQYDHDTAPISVNMVRRILAKTALPDSNVLGFILDYAEKTLYFGPTMGEGAELQTYDLKSFLTKN